MIRTDFWDLPPLSMGLMLGGLYTDFFYTHGKISEIAINFGLKPDYILIITMLLLAYTLWKPLKKEDHFLKKILLNTLSLKNALMTISGFLFSLSIFSFDRHLQEAPMFLASSIYIYFLACSIRLLEEKLFFELIEYLRTYFSKIGILKSIDQSNSKVS